MGDKRIAGRIGGTVDLNVTFLRNGASAEPFAVRRVDIYRAAIVPENKLAEVVVVDPDDASYPAPILRQDSDSDGTVEAGEFILPFDIPSDWDEGIYFDVWNVIWVDPGTDADLDDETLWSKCCGRFWVKSDGFYCTDGLESLSFAFEPLHLKFQTPEVKDFEVGIMPLPLYDFDADLAFPAIVQSTATFTIETLNCELLVDNAQMHLGLRQGSYRTNPYVWRYRLTTSDFLRGTYRARLTMTLPDGTVHVSKNMYIEIS